MVVEVEDLRSILTHQHKYISNRWRKRKPRHYVHCHPASADAKVRKKYSRFSHLRSILAAKGGELALLGELLITALDDVDAYLIVAKGRSPYRPHDMQFRRLADHAYIAVRWFKGEGKAPVSCQFVVDHLNAAFGLDLATKDFINHVIDLIDE